MTWSKRQLLATTWWTKGRYKSLDGIICHGAVRSGKTMALTVGFFLWSMASYQNQVFALCGKTVGALRRNLLLPLPSWLGGLFRITEHRAENKLTVHLGNRKNTYYLFGGQDDSSCALIQGITLAGALLDEAALMPRSFVEQTAARCSVEGAKLWLSCNPDSPEHWLYREWICKAGEKRLLCLHFTMEDNPSLSKAVLERYKRLYSGVFYRRFVLGQWCAAQGRIYDFDREKHCLTEEKIRAFIDGSKNRQFSTISWKKSTEGGHTPLHRWTNGGFSSKNVDFRGRVRWYISVDYGTRNPFSAGLWAVRSGVAVRVREYYHDGRATGKNLTDEEYADALEALAGDRNIEFVIIDPSAASMIAALRKRGRFSVRRAKNAVLPGIRKVASLLRGGRLYISEDCRDAIREFALYCWEEDESKDTPKKENDHAMDDIRYFAMGVMGMDN